MEPALLNIHLPVNDCFHGKFHRTIKKQIIER